MNSKIVFLAAVVLAVEAGHQAGHGAHGRADRGPGRDMHQEMHRNHEARFQEFVGVTRNCLNEVFPKAGLAEDQQKTLLSMIRPIHELEREQRSQRKDVSDDDNQEKGANSRNRPRYQPPFKCSPQGELVHLSPAELYVQAMDSIIERTSKISDRQKAQQAMKEALPCMDRMFKSADATAEQPITEKPSEQTQTPAG